MKSGVIARIAAAACATALAACLMTGCFGGPAATMNEEQQANRAYMSQVNQTMEELDSSLDGFVNIHTGISRDLFTLSDKIDPVSQ